MLVFMISAYSKDLSRYKRGGSGSLGPKNPNELSDSILSQQKQTRFIQAQQLHTNLDFKRVLALLQNLVAIILVDNPMKAKHAKPPVDEHGLCLANPARVLVVGGCGASKTTTILNCIARWASDAGYNFCAPCMPPYTVIYSISSMYSIHNLSTTV